MTGEIKAALRAKRAELVAMQGEKPIIERYADPMDQAMANAYTRRVSSEHDRIVIRIREIDEALAAIESGEYGICCECDEEISAKRLREVPWARRCRDCQELKEEAGRLVGAPADVSLELEEVYG